MIRLVLGDARVPNDELETSGRLSLLIPCHVHWPRSCCQSCARTAAICKKACFRGPSGCILGRVCSDRSCVRGALVRRGCTAGAWATTWVRGGGACRCGWAAYVGRVPLSAAQTYVGVVRAGAWGAGRHGVFPQCGVEHAWALGLMRHPVALSGLLLWWPPRAFDCCCVGERCELHGQGHHLIDPKLRPVGKSGPKTTSTHKS